MSQSSFAGKMAPMKVFVLPGDLFFEKGETLGLREPAQCYGVEIQ